VLTTTLFVELVRATTMSLYANLLCILFSIDQWTAAK